MTIIQRDDEDDSGYNHVPMRIVGSISGPIVRRDDAPPISPEVWPELDQEAFDRIERIGHGIVPWILAACVVAVFLILAFEPDCEPVNSARDCAAARSVAR